MRPKRSEIYAYKPMTGVKTDFSTLLKRFVETGSVRYEQFAEVWRDMKMPLMFSGRQSDGEVREVMQLYFFFS
jgi:snRNA-activating protein complex subunit 1